MTILHKGMFREMGVVFLLCLVSALTLVVVGKLLQLKGLLVGQNVGIFNIVKIFLFLSPTFLILLIPIGCMLSIFLCFLRMATDRELTALQSAGLRMKNFVCSPLIFALLCTGLAFVISFKGIPWGANNFRQTTMEILETKARVVLQPGVFNTQFPGLTIFARNVEPRTQDLEGIFVRDEKRGGGNTVIVAPRGAIKSESKQGEIYFVLQDGQIYRARKKETSVIGFERYRLRLDPSSMAGDADLEEKRPREMSWQELEASLRDPEVQGMDQRMVILEMHKKVALPLACLVLGMFAVPLAMSLEGMGRQYGALLALLGFLMFYSLFSVSYSMGKTGALSPHLCPWIPDIFFALLAVLAYYLSAKGQEVNFVNQLRSLVYFFKPGGRVKGTWRD